MSERNVDRNRQDQSDETIFLSKILLFTNNTHELAERLRDYSESTVNTNCLNTIGMYPLISRISTDMGTLCMSIWIISAESRFDQFRMAYYSGSSHSIILNINSDEQSDLSDLYNLTPQGVPTTVLSIANDDSNDSNVSNSFNTENDERLILLRSISRIDEINSVFEEIGQKIIQDLISGEYQTFTPQMVKPSNVYKLFNKRSFEKVETIVNQLGYNLSEEGVVMIPKDFYTYEIDFYRNQVKANITSCLFCEKRCKHYRKLCVIEDDQGFSNTVNFDNLRALAILYSIHDGEFISLTGEKDREDITHQLTRLKEIFEVNCPTYKDEQEFLKQQKKRKKKKNRKPN
ncbi:MAG: hypothetical protein FK733_05900 [Asgard group archaeon]|nr:hypothetical protein [Asgard group archaeon]